MFTPLVWVRRIKTFAMFHIFADFTIAFGLVVITVYAFIHAGKNGWAHGGQTNLINKETFLSFLGTAIYSYEGIGIVIPI